MKKLISALLAMTMVFALAACSGNGGSSASPSPSEPAAPAIPDAITILNTVWGTYADDEKFAAAGGDYDNSVSDAPGSFDLATPENLTYLLSVPEDKIALVDDAASLMHMMNGNTFTCGALHLADESNTEAFTAAMKDALQNKQWMCGFPEKLVIADLGGGYVISMYGNQDLVDNFRDKLQASFESTTIVYDEAVL